MDFANLDVNKYPPPPPKTEMSISHLIKRNNKSKVLGSKQKHENTIKTSVASRSNKNTRVGGKNSRRRKYEGKLRMLEKEG